MKDKLGSNKLCDGESIKSLVVNYLAILKNKVLNSFLYNFCSLKVK